MDCPSCGRKALAPSSVVKCNVCGAMVCAYCKKGYTTCQTCKKGKYVKM